MTRYSSNQSDPYLASNGVLLNSLGITAQDGLDIAERLFVSWRETNLPRTFVYDDQLLSRVHRHLFQDLYPWAGQYRTVNISKGEAPFAPPLNIGVAIKALVKKYPIETLRSASADNFATFLANIISEYNAIHPFREGNGRSIRGFKRGWYRIDRHATSRLVTQNRVSRGAHRRPPDRRHQQQHQHRADRHMPPHQHQSPHSRRALCRWCCGANCKRYVIALHRSG